MWPGYSRLMGADEEGTLGRLKRLRAELVNPKIAEHGGRVIKTTGDGLLLEFSSVVGAVRCVVQVRTAIALPMLTCRRTAALSSASASTSVTS
jgi:class 3 adenylate cyclase